MTIVIRRVDLDTIVEHSQETYPKEACGILLGARNDDLREVNMVFSAKNMLESETSYQIDPQDQLDIFVKADELSLEVVGYYHSHPYWQAQPSSIDTQSANHPCCSYIIHSNTDNEVRSFHWDGNEFRTEEIIVSEETDIEDE